MVKEAYVVMFYDKQEDDMRCVGVYPSLEAAAYVYASFLITIGHGEYTFGYGSYSQNGVSSFYKNVLEMAKQHLELGDTISDETAEYLMTLQALSTTL